MVAGLTSTLKRHDLFIRTAGQLQRQFPQARFAVFGNAPRKPTKWLYNTAYEYSLGIKRLVQEEGLAERFIWAGFCPDVPAVMSSLDILMHPCDVEGFGRVAIEAMAAGRPVVGPRSGGIAESVVDGETGFLVDAGRVDAFASATARLIRDADLRRTFGEKGRLRVKERFSQQQHASLIDQIYSEICDRRDPLVRAGKVNAVECEVLTGPVTRQQI
jgi:glycosyltransferase involved in cell wall biosynthesis